MISAGRFQPGYRVRVTVEYSAERIILRADGSPVVTSISGKIKILSKFRFGVGMIIDVYAAVYQPCKPCQLAWLAYQVPAAFLSRLCEYEITAVIAVQSIFIMVVVGLAEVNTVLLVNRSREFVIAYLAPPRLRTSVELVCDLGGVIGSFQDETVVCFPSAGSRDLSAVSGRDVIYVRIGYSSFIDSCNSACVSGAAEYAVYNADVRYFCAAADHTEQSNRLCGVFFHKTADDMSLAVKRACERLGDGSRRSPDNAILCADVLVHGDVVREFSLNTAVGVIYIG